MKYTSLYSFTIWYKRANLNIYPYQFLSWQLNLRTMLFPLTIYLAKIMWMTYERDILNYSSSRKVHITKRWKEWMTAYSYLHLHGITIISINYSFVYLNADLTTEQIFSSFKLNYSLFKPILLYYTHGAVFFANNGLTLFLAWITTHTANKATVEVFEWIVNFIPHIKIDVITYPCWD